jgi:nucleotide-binding universal stress UspA family protein
MKVLATFDGSEFAESTLRELAIIAGLPNAEITLLAAADEPRGRRRGVREIPIAASDDLLGRGTGVIVQAPAPDFAETKGQAVERRAHELEDYLRTLVGRLPAGPHYEVEAHVAPDAAATIIERAEAERVDLIVMATHSRGGLTHALFGSTTEQVIRSGVAPVLVVHPKR